MPTSILLVLLASYLASVQQLTPISLWNRVPPLFVALPVLLGLPLLPLISHKRFVRKTATGSNRSDSSTTGFWVRTLHLKTDSAALTVAWIFGSLLLVATSNWVEFVNHFVSTRTTAGFLLTVAPSLISLALIWLTSAFQSSGSILDAAHESVARIRSQLVMTLAPLVFILLFKDLIVFSVSSNQWIYQAGCFALGLVLLVFLLPKLLCRILPTESIKETELGKQLLSLSLMAGLTVHDIRSWRTENRIHGAFVFGLVPNSRTILFTDRLLKELDFGEIAAIFLHELGHIQRHHSLQRILAFGLPFFATLFIGQISHLPFVISLLSAVSIAFFILGAIAHFLEFEADRVANRLMVDHGHNPQALSSALCKIGRATQRTSRMTWLYPSIEERISQLEKLAPVPTPASRSKQNRQDFKPPNLESVPNCTSIRIDRNN